MPHKIMKRISDIFNGKLQKEFYDQVMEQRGYENQESDEVYSIEDEDAPTPKKSKPRKSR